jgi:hypothetical protein
MMVGARDHEVDGPCFAPPSQHDSLFLARRHTMLDVVYVVITLGFFAIMLAYIRGCEALGREDTNKEDRT